MVHNPRLRTRRPSYPVAKTKNMDDDEDSPERKPAFQLRRRHFSADGIPRSRTSDNGNWTNATNNAVRHPVSGACRPQSSLFPSYPVHPNFTSIKHNWNDTHATAAARRRISRDRSSLTYELSQDLQDKQLELLEKKYGGRRRARHAALVIQRAYRRHSMQKKFDRISSAQQHPHKIYKTQSVYDAPDSPHVMMTITETSGSHHGGRPNGMTRSTSATARMHPQRVVDVSPSTGVYDNIPLRGVRCEAPVPQQPPTPPRPLDGLPPASRSVPIAINSVLQADGVLRKSGRAHRSRQNAQSESPVRQLLSSSAGLPSGSLGLSVEHSANMSVVTICDAVSSSTVAHDQANTSPVWKRLDELMDHDSGVGSNGQLNNSPTHQAFLEYDNVVTAIPPFPKVPYDSQPVVFPRKEPPSPRRNSGSSRTVHATNHTKSQRRAASASRVPTQPRISETKRKRQYRVGLNLFNKKPERGMEYLIEKGFVTETPSAVARFLISRKGLSKQKIGEYLGSQADICIAALQCFAGEIDLCGLEIDQALRKFQTYFRLPGEAQKIERVIEVFSDRYLACNPKSEKIFVDTLTVLRVAYGIILLNTDLHNPSIKKERKMKPEDFVKNMRGALGDNTGVDDQMLRELYMRIKAEEFKPGNDHVTQVQRVDKQIIGDNKPVLPLPHRRLVCFCRLYEVYDENKKERNTAHQREVFLFNDLMVITKQNGAKKKNAPIIYRCRLSFPLTGTKVQLFSTQHHPNGLKLVNTLNQKVLIMLNARNEHDRDKFVEDLRESVLEMDEMESIRLETEVEKQQFAAVARAAENRDSGVADIEDTNSSASASSSTPDQNSAKRAMILSNSLLDMSDQQTFKQVPVTRRCSTGSLDSGMCMPGSSSASTQSTPSTDCPIPATKTIRGSIFGGFFARKSGNYQFDK